MAQRKRKRKKRSVASRPEPYPGWMWMLFGLAIGLSVAFAIYMKDRDRFASPQSVASEPASLAAPIESPSLPAPAPETAPDPDEESEDDAEPRFSFYSMLPNFEVVIPEEETDVTPDLRIEAVQAPGTYVLQAGSFSDPADADRRRAELALLGIESRVQRIAIDDRTYHRVRIGPMTDLDELNLIRSQLRAADIDALRIRLGD